MQSPRTEEHQDLRWRAAGLLAPVHPALLPYRRLVVPEINVGVIGAGAWGTTLASLLTARTVARLWAREPEVVESVTQTRQNRVFLDGFRLPDELTVTNQLDEALDRADVVVVAVPSQHLRATMTAAQPFVPRQATVVSVAKGIELHSGQRMTEVLSEVLVGHDRYRIGVLSGPNLAREIIGGQPAATCVALADPDRATSIQRLFGGEAPASTPATTSSAARSAVRRRT